MKFLIISHANHYKNSKELFSYAPYVREMNIWLKYVNDVEIIAPFKTELPTKIDLPYKHNNIKYTEIPEISVARLFKTFIYLPLILWRIFKACKKADHIHLRCPGNIGLLGCLVQICFPSKIKTAKYAGNWDPKAKQPLSYKFQKWLLSNTFLTKNITVLVYGDWENQSKNIKAFFTATYYKKEIPEVITKDFLEPIKFIFVGSLVPGKRPKLTLQIIEKLQKNNINCTLDIFGDGVLRKELETYIIANKLNGITLQGNQEKGTIKDYLLQSHFSILASKSEGWPKAIAESMFFGVIPIATSISCVPYMLDYGKRGFLVESELDKAVNIIINALKNESDLKNMSLNAQNWSQKFTLDVFENEIKKLMN